MNKKVAFAISIYLLGIPVAFVIGYFCMWFFSDFCGFSPLVVAGSLGALNYISRLLKSFQQNDPLRHR